MSQLKASMMKFCWLAKFSSIILSRQLKLSRKGVETMQQKHFDKVKNEKGFIAAIDQSRGNTPKALAAYGVTESSYSAQDEMFEFVHEMLTRIITLPAYDSYYILA